MTTLIINVPGGLSSDGIQLAVDVTDDELGEVLVRPAHSTQRWERFVAVGGTVEVRG